MDFSDAELSFQVSPETERFLCERLLDQNQPIAERFRALNSLRNLSGAAPRNALIQATRDTSNLLAREAAFALGQMQDAEAIPALESVRNDRSLHPIVGHEDSVMGLSKTEVNLRRLLATAPQQQNKAKLVHYVATLREQLEQLAEERSPEGLPRVSKAQLNEYSEKIEAIAAKLDVTESSTQVPQEPSFEAKVRESSSTSEGESIHSPKGLRRRFLPPAEQRSPSTVEDSNTTKSVKLDAAAHAHIEKHRKLQEDLTDEMVDLARQLKESSLMMSQSIKNTEKTLDSTEKAVEQSLASTGHANTRAVEVYSQSLKTSCFTWLLIFVMTCIFIMVVLLIRVT